MRGKYHYERDDESFPADAYRFDTYPGVSWYVRGWHTEPDEDTEWTGYEVRSGSIVATMIGDDRQFLFEPEEAIPLEERDYCHSCGQIGCTHDGLDRSGDD